MSQQPLVECPVCWENKEKKDSFPLKCCGNFLCKSCETLIREKNGHLLPNNNYRFICCPLCRQMEAVSFQLASQISRNVSRNYQEFSFYMAPPNYELTPEQQNQRNVREIHQLIELQKRREMLERDYMDRQNSANILAAMRLVNRPNVQEMETRNGGHFVNEPTTPPGVPPGWIEPVQPQVPAPTTNLTRPTARRQLRTASPVDEPNRARPCFNPNCHHTTVFRCRTHPSVVCCRNCTCPQC